MRIVFFPEDGQPAEVREFDGTLESAQVLVDGYIEHMRLKNGLLLVCNEEGLLLEFEPNRVVPPALSGFYDVWRSTIRGPFFITRDGGEDYADLSDVEIKQVLLAFGEPEWNRAE